MTRRSRGLVAAAALLLGSLGGAGAFQGQWVKRSSSPLGRRHRAEKRDSGGESLETFADTGAGTKGLVSGLTALVNLGSAPAEPIIREKARVSPQEVLEGLRRDFQDKEYLWSGKITDELYAEECTFTDPTLTFRGLDTFKRNLANLDPILTRLVPESKRKVELRDISLDEAERQVVAKWRMVGEIQLPWRPVLDLNGQTIFAYDPDKASGRIKRYTESWEIPASAALGQILRPGNLAETLQTGSGLGSTSTDSFPQTKAGREVPEHWPGRLDGSPPPDPQPSCQLRKGEDWPVVVLPGFGNDAVDYSTPFDQPVEVGLAACLSRRGFRSVSTVPVKRLDWLNVLRGLFDPAFLANNATASGPAFNWYLNRAQATIEAASEEGARPVMVLGHSAGGWLARALMDRQGEEWVKKNVAVLVSLGSPHAAPPEDIPDMTRGVLRNLNRVSPGADFSAAGVRYFTVAGAAVQGDPNAAQDTVAGLAFNSYEMVCGKGDVPGDGVVPVCAAHLPDKASFRISLDTALHSINVPGTVLPTDQWYGAEPFIDEWLAEVLLALRQDDWWGGGLTELQGTLDKLIGGIFPVRAE